jgi:FK506-binding protein 8
MDDKVESNEEVVNDEATQEVLNNEETREDTPNDDEDEGSNEEESRDGWLDILENKQLMKKTLTPGDESSLRPERGNKCLIDIKTVVKDTGESIPSETALDVIAFVGDYDVLHGVDLSLGLMHVGETALVSIHPRFAYGEKGKEPDIPGNCTLLCEVTLKSVEVIELEEGSLPIADKIKYGRLKKDRGNFWFERSDYQSAIHCYRRAIEFADATDDEMVIYHSSASGNNGNNSSVKMSKILTDSQKVAERAVKQVGELVSLRSTAYNNLAAAQIKVDALDQALKSVNSSLDLNPNNVKALYRKSRILSAKGDLGEAIDVLKAAVKLEPESKTLTAELSKLAGLRRTQLDKEKKMYQKMLQVDSKTSPVKQESIKNTSLMTSPLLMTGVTAFGALLLGLAMYSYLS